MNSTENETKYAKAEIIPKCRKTINIAHITGRRNLRTLSDKDNILNYRITEEIKMQTSVRTLLRTSVGIS
jgi:hypothetical protein